MVTYKGSLQTPLLWASIGFTWVLIALRVQPWPFSDYGVFLAVGRRLEAGEILYEQVWDNKDPLTYYTIAMAQYFHQPGL